MTAWTVLENVKVVGISQTGREVLCDFTYMWSLQKNKLREKGIKFVITREWGFGSEGFE